MNQATIPVWYVQGKPGARRREARRILFFYHWGTIRSSFLALLRGQVIDFLRQVAYSLARRRWFRQFDHPYDDPTYQHPDRRLKLTRQLWPLAVWEPQTAEVPEVLPFLVSWIGVLFANPILLQGDLLTDDGIKRHVFHYEYPSWSLKKGAEILTQVLRETRSRQWPRLYKWYRGQLCPLSRSELTPPNAAALSTATAIIFAYLNPEKPFNSTKTLRVIEDLLINWGGEMPPIHFGDVVGLLDLHNPPKPTRINLRQDQTVQQELLSYLDRLPLGGDLHVHLVGTGSARFWVDFTNENGIHKHPKSSAPFTESDFGITEVGAPWSHFEWVFRNRDHLKDNSDFLRQLINWNTVQAKKQRILYIEYSAGFFLFRNQRLWSAVKQAVAEAEKQGVFIRFLVGVHRKTPFYGPRDVFDLHLLWQTDTNLGQPLWQLSLNHLIAQLDDLGVWNDPLVVGVDLHGYEASYPPSQVVTKLPSLILELQEHRKGFRFHAGEGIETLKELFHLLIPWPSGLPCRNRIGHGTGLGRLIRYQDFPSIKAVLDQLDQIIREGIPIEVNMTSNKVLLDIRHEDHPLGSFIERGWPVVLGTDDPGIFGTTLRGEFELAIKNGHVRSKDDLRNLVTNSIKYSFAEDSLKDQLLKELAADISKAEGLENFHTFGAGWQGNLVL